MIAENIREHLRREPFVPFRLILSSGNQYDVDNPELVVVLKSAVFVAFADSDRYVHVPLLHVAAVETINHGRGRRSARGKRR